MVLIGLALVGVGVAYLFGGKTRKNPEQSKS
jgi:hypothetical protein